MSASPHLQLGKAGEEIAARFLEEKGYRILGKNYRCALGEIDLIAEFENTVVFAEVKTRSSTRFGNPQEAVNRQRISRLARAGEFYLREKKLTTRSWRIDVLSLLSKEGDFHVEQIENVTG